MDIEQLRDIIKRVDGEGFCQFFHQLKPEEVLELSKDVYNEIMSLAHQLGKENVIKDYSFFYFIHSTAQKYLKIAIRGGDVLQTAFISLFYYNLLHHLYPDRDKAFAEVLMYKGISLSLLAEHGVNITENLKEAIKCFDEAAPIFKKERLDQDYALIMSNKGNTLHILAEQGVETINNLEDSLKCYDEAAVIFKSKGPFLDYAGTLMSKGISLQLLAEHGAETIENLKESVKHFDEAALIFKSEKVDLDYARTIINKGISLLRLAEQGINTTKNLEDSINSYDEAAIIFKREKAELDYARVLMNKGINLSKLSEQGKNILKNLEESINCYDEAASIFERYGAEMHYARYLMHKGINLSRLADRKVNTIQNLREAIECYNRAIPIFKREGAELSYARILMNKGVSLRILAEQGVDVESSFSSAMELYEEAEGIFYEKGSLLSFVMARANRIIGMWWMYQETSEEDYLIKARKLCNKALEVVPHITHPAKKDIEEIIIRINAILADKYLASDRAKYDEIIKWLADIKKDTERIPRLEEKINLILSNIEKSTHQIIKIIKRSGEEISEEAAKGFTSLAHDLRSLTEEQQKNLLEELCRLLNDSSFQSNLLNESPPEKSNRIRNIFQRIAKTVNEIAGHMPAALIAHQILYYFDSLWSEVLHLTDINSAIVLGMVLSPFIVLKNRLSKSGVERA